MERELPGVCSNNPLRVLCVVQVHSGHLEKVSNNFLLKLGRGNTQTCERTLLTSWGGRHPACKCKCSRDAGSNQQSMKRRTGGSAERMSIALL